MGIKLRLTKDGKGGYYRMFHCPGCEDIHMVSEGWTWNGSMEEPTFAPSVLVTYTSGEDGSKTICHSFVTRGHIEYLADCSHKLAGQTVEIPDWDEKLIISSPQES